MKKIKTAFILGAGLGMRLRPLTNTCPKPLLPIRGRPMILYIFERVAQIGIERIILNTHHCAEKYAEIFPNKKWKNMPLIFRHEPVLLDTGGGIKNIEDLIGDEENILVHNGDVVTDLPLEKLIAHHFDAKNEVTLALRSKEHPKHIGFNKESGKIEGIRGNLNEHDLIECLFTGIYVVNRKFLRRLEKGKVKSVIPIFQQMIEEDKGALGGIILDEGKWLDAGTLEEYERIK